MEDGAENMETQETEDSVLRNEAQNTDNQGQYI